MQFVNTELHFSVFSLSVRGSVGGWESGEEAVLITELRHVLAVLLTHVVFLKQELA